MIIGPARSVAMVRVSAVRMRMRAVSYTLSMYRYFLPTNIQRFGMSRLYVVGLKSLAIVLYYSVTVLINLIEV